MQCFSVLKEESNFSRWWAGGCSKLRKWASHMEMGKCGCVGREKMTDGEADFEDLAVQCSQVCGGGSHESVLTREQQH